MLAADDIASHLLLRCLATRRYELHDARPMPAESATAPAALPTLIHFPFLPARDGDAMITLFRADFFLLRNLR